MPNLFLLCSDSLVWSWGINKWVDLITFVLFQFFTKTNFLFHKMIDRRYLEWYDLCLNI